MKRTIAIAAIFIVAIGGFVAYQAFNATPKQPRLVLGNPTRGTLVVSVSGSGNIVATKEIEVKPLVTGELIAVVAAEGQTVKKNDVLARIDPSDGNDAVRDAEKGVRDTQANLESTLLALEKLLKPPDDLALLQAENALAQSKRELQDLLDGFDALTLMQAENALTSARESQKKTTDALIKAREDGITDVANAFLDLPTIITGLENILTKSTIVSSQSNINWYYDQARFNQTQQRVDTITSSYRATEEGVHKSRNEYDTNLASYTALTRSADPARIDAEIIKTYETVRTLSEALKTARTFIGTTKDALSLRDATIPAEMTNHQNIIDAYLKTANSHLSSLLASKQNNEDTATAIESANRTVQEKAEGLEKLKKGTEERDISAARERVAEQEASLEKLKRGADDLDIATQRLTVKKAENALSDTHVALDDARKKREDYTIRAPLDGVIMHTNAVAGQYVSQSNVIATIAAKDVLAEISLNEVDASQIVVGQKANLTFDAFPDTRLSAHVVAIDPQGEVDQGVVNFTVSLALDEKDQRIKTGMTVSADIVTASRDNTLLIPYASIIHDRDESFVRVADSPEGPVRMQRVIVGLSNDQSTEIREGLAEEDAIVLRTIQAEKQQSDQPQQRNNFVPSGGRVLQLQRR